MKKSLFEKNKLGSLMLENRIAMAPMTRSRTTQPGDIPNELMATYYAQRAGAGLIISEGTPVSDVGRGYSLTPGIYTTEQINGWKNITKKVHEKGGKIFVQLWHVGRRSNTQISGQTPHSASAIKAPGQVYGPLKEGGFGMVDTDTPKSMTKEDITQTIKDFKDAARNAIDAGFDGIEIHGAHGYLLDQFFRLDSNTRTDEYGGSIQNRVRFALEVTDAITKEIGAEKVGIRLSPFVVEGNSKEDPTMIELTYALLEELNKREIAYVHFSENISNFSTPTMEFRENARKLFKGTIMLAGKLTKEKAQEHLELGHADIFAFGQPFITNPDLVERMKHDITLTPVDYASHSTFYGGGAKGYTDYTTYN